MLDGANGMALLEVVAPHTMELRLYNDLGEAWRAPDWTDARFLGGFKTRVPYGVYALHAREGDREFTRVLLIVGQHRETLTAEPIDAAFPLANTGQLVAEHATALHRLSSAPMAMPRLGAEILVCFRAAGAPLSGWHPTVQLRPLGSREIIDLGGRTLLSDEAEGFRAVLLPAAPGTYELEFLLGTKLVRFALHASEGWRTIICLRYGRVEDEDGPRWEVERAGLALARPGLLFQPEHEVLRWTEAASDALRARRRWPICEQRALIERQWRAEDGNPFLGVLAAHLLLVRGGAVVQREGKAKPISERGAPGRGATAFAALTDEEKQIFEETVYLLQIQLGHAHPDVAALASLLPNANQPEVASPPALRASANLLIEASNAGRAILTPAAWARTQGAVAWQPFLAYDASIADLPWQHTVVAQLVSLVRQGRELRGNADVAEVVRRLSTMVPPDAVRQVALGAAVVAETVARSTPNVSRGLVARLIAGGLRMVARRAEVPGPADRVVEQARKMPDEALAQSVPVPGAPSGAERKEGAETAAPLSPEELAHRAGIPTNILTEALAQAHPQPASRP